MIDILNDPKLNEKMMSNDACYWAVRHGIRLMGNTIFTLENCSYMGDIMRDDSRYIAVMKGTQARITTAFMLRAIHNLIYGIYPKGVIYYFPSRDSVEDFSKTRFTPLINDNPCIKKHLRSTDSVFVKKVGKAFLSLKGATATKNIHGHKKDSMAVRSTPADEAILDEMDLFEDSIVNMIPDRLLDSKFKRERYLGSPTIPDFGIDHVFGQSDQKNPMVKCTACGSYTNMVDDFPAVIRYKRESTHEQYTPYFACIKCGDEINPLTNEFVAKYPDRDMSGYHVPHLITPNCEVPLVVSRYREAQIDGSKMGTFYNSILGLPWIDVTDALRREDVFACCGNDAMRTDLSIKETAMGVDVGKAYHAIVIGEKVDEKRTKIVYMCRVKGFDAVHDIAKKYNVRSAVVDRRPYEEEFEKFQKSESYRVFGAEYKPKQRNFMQTDDKTGTYSVHKVQMFDKTHNWVKNREIELPRKCDEVIEFARQLCNCAKILETDENTGDITYKYITTGDKADHYRSALNYLWLALGDLTHYQGMGAPGFQTVGAGDYDPITWAMN